MLTRKDVSGDEKTGTPKMGVRREVRFAVVMYGGVSLAIYINGVTQELFGMVRATATHLDDEKTPLLDELDGAERVYRKIGQLLGRDGDEPWKEGDPIRTRFVIDILSGTSAGGINAIYLAKALATGQSIGQLKDLWITEGDIEKLINDRKSVEGLGLNAQRPPKSLLNSQRMYRKLLDAFEGMENTKNPSREGTKSPYAEELDLFVTATDIHGLPINLRLSDGVAEEKRHRNVFRFAYGKRLGEDHNDFHAENNPFLAFAARCTSAFPFAFEPMKLTDVNAVLRDPLTEEQLEKRWGKFFPEYQRLVPPSRSGNEDETKFVKRSFGDGGYLDNKPFGYATDTLASRRSSLPVKRKLLYIEPSPEEIKRDASNGDGPNAIENVSVALSLARYETIREDMERILARNRLTERARHLLSGIADDFRHGGRKPDDQLQYENYPDMDLEEMVKQRGMGYGGYHRLKVAAVTDEITAVISHAAEFNLQSDEFLAVRYLVRAWRENKYTEYKSLAPNKETQNKFLLEYDLSYRIRRLDFVLNKIVQLRCVDENTKKILDHYDKVAKAGTDSELREYAVEPTSNIGKRRFRQETERFRKELKSLQTGPDAQTGLSEVRNRLCGAREKLDLPGSGNPLYGAVEYIKRDPNDPEKMLNLKEILEKNTDKERLSAARQIVENPEWKLKFDGFARELADYIARCTIEAASDCERYLTEENEEENDRSPSDFFPGAKAVVRHYYDYYDYYDSVLYPVLQTTEAGEEFEPVEVARVSPEDATSIIDGKNGGRSKLAGMKLRNFGAFLDRGWRLNDILWGRLDGAERIITTLLAGTDHEDKSEKLIEEAQKEILDEELGLDRANSKAKYSEFLARAIIGAAHPDAGKKEIQELANRDGQRETGLRTAVRASLEENTIREYLRSGEYKINEADSQATVRTLARSTTVVGSMLEDIADCYSASPANRMAAWVTRLGWILWGLVEVSVPRSLAQVIFRYWVKLLYLFGALMVIAGIVLPGAYGWRFGLVVLGITATTHFGTYLLGRFMRGGGITWKFIKFALAITVIALAIAVIVLAVYGGYALLGDDTPDTSVVNPDDLRDNLRRNATDALAPWTTLAFYAFLGVVLIATVLAQWDNLTRRGRRSIGIAKREGHRVWSFLKPPGRR